MPFISGSYLAGCLLFYPQNVFICEVLYKPQNTSQTSIVCSSSPFSIHRLSDVNHTQQVGVCSEGNHVHCMNPNSIHIHFNTSSVKVPVFLLAQSPDKVCLCVRVSASGGNHTAERLWGGTHC